MTNEMIVALSDMRKYSSLVLAIKLQQAGIQKKQMGFVRSGVDESDPHKLVFYFEYMTRKGRDVRESMSVTREEAELGSYYCCKKLADTLVHFIDKVLELYGDGKNS